LVSGGLGDWGYISIERWQNLGLEWSGTETSMAKRCSALGLVVPFSLLPCVAPLPWSTTIRRGRQVGHEIKRRGKFLLSPTKTFDEMKSTKTFYRWQEDWVVTDRYYSLEPIWATDFSLEYLKINTEFYGISKIPFRYTCFGQKPRHFFGIFGLEVARDISISRGFS